MKIGIILYSQTGHTLEVAHKLTEKLTEKGHEVAQHPLEVIGQVEPGKPVKFQSLPDISPYDAYVFAAPVQAFSLCMPMKAYLKELPSLDGKPIACYITKQLKSPMMGGKKAIRQLTKPLKEKGANITATAMISWKDDVREAQIKETVEHISAVF